MTKLLEQAFKQISELCEARQDEAAQVLLDVVSQDPNDVRLSADQITDLSRRLDDPDDSIASEHDVAAAFQKIGV
jgi:ABC-type nitrate/sulfonate/bicarbonate transport system substrate-binding protein